MTIHRTLLAPAAAAAAVATLALLPTAAVAAPDDVETFTSVGAAAGVDDLVDGQDAARVNFQHAGGVVSGYCIDFGVDYNAGATFTSAPRSAVDRPNLGTAAWIATNAPSTGGPLGDADWEAAAVQLAIWSYTDGLDIASQNVMPDVKVRAQELADAASGAALNEGPSAYSLTVAADRDGDEVTVTADLADAGTPVSGAPITLNVAGTALDVSTNDTGTATATVDVDVDAGTATATFTGTLPAGTVLVASDGSQPFVTTTPATVTRQVSDDFAAKPAPPTEEPTPKPPEPDPTPDPTPPAPDPTPSDPEPTPKPPAPEPTPDPTPELTTGKVVDELPRTGPVAGLAVLTGGLTLASTGMALRRRRR